jgi:gamma-glutamyl:cysteine ligase YbdK (ATP-grasp superfamily)
MSPARPAFSAFGIELEYMIVDRATLAVRPIADRLLRDDAGGCVNELPRGTLAWSNELVMHLVEIKNVQPDADLATLPAAFQAEVAAIDARLAAFGARLMPTGMHPWMDPASETRLWHGEHADIYATYDRIFGCCRQGFANLQSMHLNLPFADDAEFARLHAAARLLLPVLPALAASSPFAGGRLSGFLDCRMDAYRGHQARLPSSMGQVIPDTVASPAEYREHILAPMYCEAAPLDPAGTLCHEWLNARGAIPRFERDALEIRVIDLQECPQADLAIAAATVAAVRALYDQRWSGLAGQQAMATTSLAAILADCIRDGERALIADAGYLRLFGFPGRRGTAGELWRHLGAAAPVAPAFAGSLELMLEQGPLARRILNAVGPEAGRPRLEAVYRALCDCLADGRMFSGLDGGE